MTSDPDDLDVERISDTLDRAAHEDGLRVQDCVNKVLNSVERAPKDFDGCTCVDCGEEIPAERLSTGAFRDIHCQVVHETKKRHMRRD